MIIFNFHFSLSVRKPKGLNMNSPVRSSGNDIIRNHTPARVKHCVMPISTFNPFGV